MTSYLFEFASHQPATHYCDIIMSASASQITGVSIVYSTVCSGADKKKTQRHWLCEVIHRWPVNSPHKGPSTRKMFPFDAVIMDTINNKPAFVSCNGLALSGGKSSSKRMIAYFTDAYLSQSTSHETLIHALKCVIIHYQQTYGMSVKYNGSIPVSHFDLLELNWNYPWQISCLPAYCTCGVSGGKCYLSCLKLNIHNMTWFQISPVDSFHKELAIGKSLPILSKSRGFGTSFQGPILLTWLNFNHC